MLLWGWSGKRLKEEADRNGVSERGMRAVEEEKISFEAPVLNSSKKEFSIVLLSGFGGQPRLIAIACIVFWGGFSETPLTNNSREASHCVKLTKNWWEDCVL